MSTQKIYQTAITAIEKNLTGAVSLNHLDIGSGLGELIRKLRGVNRKIISSACDYTDTLMELEDQKVDIVDINKYGLPYDDEAFDIVTATEIIEHLENPRSFLRDINRILKPEGICVSSTPNVLNINSRIRYLWFGFSELFGPLPIEARTIESCAGHISPIPYFYLYHAMRESGFNEITLEVDKYQRSGMIKLVLLYLPIQIKDKLIKRKERIKFKTIDKTNQEIVNQINSPKLLLGRTIILTGQKK